MFMRIMLISTLFFYFSTATSASYENGFDEVCAVYTEAKNSSMPKQQLSQYIFDNVEARVNNIDALEAHGSVFHLDPSERYLVFKQAAEISLKHSWNCSAMKALMK